MLPTITFVEKAKPVEENSNKNERQKRLPVKAIVSIVKYVYMFVQPELIFETEPNWNVLTVRLV